MRGEIADIDHDVPRKLGSSLDEPLRLKNRFGHAFPSATNVRRNVRAARGPDVESAGSGFDAGDAGDGKQEDGQPFHEMPDNLMRRSGLQAVSWEC